MSQSQRALTKSTLRVRRQLMEAILFEQLIPYNEKPLSDDNEFVYQLGDRNRMFQCIGKECRLIAFGCMMTFTWWERIVPSDRQRLRTSSKS